MLKISLCYLPPLPPLQCCHLVFLNSWHSDQNGCFFIPPRILSTRKFANIEVGGKGGKRKIEIFVVPRMIIWELQAGWLFLNPDTDPNRRLNGCTSQIFRAPYMITKIRQTDLTLPRVYVLTRPLVLRANVREGVSASSVYG